MQKSDIQQIPLASLQLNKGQLKWLPRNPRQWTQTDIDRMARSLQRDPDFVEERPVLATPGKGGKLVVFAHNLLTEAANAAGWNAVPVVTYTPDTDEDKETIRRRALLDNGSMGRNDTDILANEWPYDAEELVDFGYTDYTAGGAPSDMGLTTKGREGADGYDEFVEKFEQKLTTDDCYTPPEVYDIVRDFVDEKVAPLAGRKIVRPFFPGGDYEDLKQYPKGCVVLDNPPFSLYSKIVRFYLENKIDFFLFGPNLTLFVADVDCTFIVCNASITYENGAVVTTGFVTNMCPGLRIWVEHTMRERILEAQKNTKELGKYEYPDNCVTSAVLGRLSANGRELKVPSSEAVYIRDLDGFKDIGKGLYGGGFLLSSAAAERAAAERAAAERAAAERAAAERAAIHIKLSPRELEIVAQLDKAASNTKRI